MHLITQSRPYPCVCVCVCVCEHEQFQRRSFLPSRKYRRCTMRSIVYRPSLRTIANEVCSRFIYPHREERAIVESIERASISFAQHEDYSVGSPSPEIDQHIVGTPIVHHHHVSSMNFLVLFAPITNNTITLFLSPTIHASYYPSTTKPVIDQFITHTTQSRTTTIHPPSRSSPSITHTHTLSLSISIRISQRSTRPRSNVVSSFKRNPRRPSYPSIIW